MESRLYIYQDLPRIIIRSLILVKRMITTCNTSHQDVLALEKYCSHCKSVTDVRTDHRMGTRVCYCCGLVLENHMIDTREEFVNTSEGLSHRTGGAYDSRLADGGLSLKIEGRKFKMPATYFTSSGIKKASSSEVKTLTSQISLANILANLCEHLSIPKTIQDNAMRLVEAFDKDQKSFKGRGLEAWGAAFLWAGSKQAGNFVDLESLERASSAELKEIKRCFVTIRSRLQICISKSSVTAYCNRILHELDVGDDFQCLVRELASHIEENEVAQGKKPSTIAAAAIYSVSNQRPESERKTASEIAKAAEVAVITLMKCYKNDISPHLSVLMSRSEE